MPVTETKEATKTCLITLVEPGSSDKVIRLHPAQHESEKIWLDNARGIERWNAIKRLMQNHAVRGTAVPDPASWHSNPKDLRTPDLKHEDIPLVRLEGDAFLEKLPDEERVAFTQKNSNAEVNKRMDHLENMVGSLAQSISHLTQAIQNQPKPEAARKPGRPKKETNEGE